MRKKKRRTSINELNIVESAGVCESWKVSNVRKKKKIFKKRKVEKAFPEVNMIMMKI